MQGIVTALLVFGTDAHPQECVAWSELHCSGLLCEHVYGGGQRGPGVSGALPDRRGCPLSRESWQETGAGEMLGELPVTVSVVEGGLKKMTGRKKLQYHLLLF